METVGCYSYSKEIRLLHLGLAHDNIASIMAGPPASETRNGQAEANASRAKGRLPLMPEIVRMNEAEVAKRLSIYGPGALMVKRLETNMNGKRGIATLVSQGDPVRPILQDYVLIRDGDGKYTVRAGDVRDHFFQDPALPEPDPLSPVLLPGIKAAAIMREAADAYYRGQEDPPSLFIIRNLSFKRPIGEGAELNVEFSKRDADTDEGEHVFEATLTGGEKNRLAALVELEYSDDGAVHIPGQHIDPEYMAESAAQVALLLLQQKQSLKNLDTIMPMYTGIDEIMIFHEIPIGANVTIDVTIEEGEGFNANARVYDGLGTLAQVITGMKGTMWPRERGAGYVTRQRINGPQS